MIWIYNIITKDDGELLLLDVSVRLHDQITEGCFGLTLACAYTIR